MRFPGSMRDHYPMRLPVNAMLATAGYCAGLMEVTPAPDEREAMSAAEDNEGREIAEEMEQQHPQWIVIFGAFTREFVCLPRFAAPPGLKVVAIYPTAAADRMSKIERLSRIREGLLETGNRTDGRGNRDR